MSFVNSELFILCHDEVEHFSLSNTSVSEFKRANKKSDLRGHRLPLDNDSAPGVEKLLAAK